MQPIERTQCHDQRSALGTLLQCKPQVYDVGDQYDHFNTSDDVASIGCPTLMKANLGFVHHVEELIVWRRNFFVRRKFLFHGSGRIPGVWEIATIALPRVIILGYFENILIADISSILRVVMVIPNWTTYLNIQLLVWLMVPERLSRLQFYLLLLVGGSLHSLHHAAVMVTTDTLPLQHSQNAEMADFKTGILYVLEMDHVFTMSVSAYPVRCPHVVAPVSSYNQQTRTLGTGKLDRCWCLKSAQNYFGMSGKTYDATRNVKQSQFAQIFTSIHTIKNYKFTRHVVMKK